MPATIADLRKRTIEALAAAGIESPEVDAEQLVFEILAFQGAANLAAGKAGDANFMRAWRAVQSLLQHSRRGHPRERDVADLSSTKQLSSQFD